MPEVAGSPEGEQDQHHARDEPGPPELGGAGEERDDDVEDSAQEEVEGEDRGQRLERVLRMDEGGDPDHGERDREPDVSHPPPAVRAGGRYRLDQRCGQQTVPSRIEIADTDV